MVPTKFKTAIVKPLIKKPDLDTNHKNYHPVSNLAFISKLIEQSIIDQFEIHFEVNGLNDDLQSATETALLHVVNNNITSMDNRCAVCMVMLDLSAAFDTLDHDILIQRLGNTQGLGPHVIKWFDSYLRGRTQRVSADDATSDPIQLLEGAVQGSKIAVDCIKSTWNPLDTCSNDPNATTMVTPTTTQYGNR